MNKKKLVLNRNNNGNRGSALSGSSSNSRDSRTSNQRSASSQNTSNKAVVKKPTVPSPKMAKANGESRDTANRIRNVATGNRSSDNRSSEMIEEIEVIQRKVDNSGVPEDLKEKLDRMVNRLRRMARFGSYSSDFELVSKYVDWTTGIPWGVYSEDQIDLEQAKRTMDKNHYGMNSVKNLILDYLAVMKLHLDQKTGTSDRRGGEGDAGNNSRNSHSKGTMYLNTDSLKSGADKLIKSRSGDQTGPNEVPASQTQKVDKPKNMSKLEGSSSHAPIICFVGLQGVGKTTMAKSIAQTLGREFARISLGALGSVTQLRGKSRSQPDAEPGQIIKALTRVGTMNPVILLDEIDKVSGKEGLLNDVMAALLEILDPEQNSTFMDHYIDYPIDLSHVMFVCTANNLGTLSAALLDRLEVIRFTSYTDEEKIVIARKYLMPDVLEATGLSTQQLIMDEEVWPQVVRPLGFDAGIRQLERNLTSLARHAARKIVEQGVDKVHVTLDNVKEFMPEGVGTLS